MAHANLRFGADGYAIYRVNAVIPGSAVDPQQLAAAQQQMAQVDAQSEGEAYLTALRDRSKVKLYGSTASQSQNGDN